MQRRCHSVFAEVLEQNVTPERITDGHDRARLSIRAQFAQKVSKIVGFTGVVTPWEPIAIIAAIAEMKHGSVPSMILRGLQ
jgi:hypothetical protein